MSIKILKEIIKNKSCHSVNCSDCPIRDGCYILSPTFPAPNVKEDYKTIVALAEQKLLELELKEKLNLI